MAGREYNPENPKTIHVTWMYSPGYVRRVQENLLAGYGNHHDDPGHLGYAGDIRSVPAIIAVLKKYPVAADGTMICTRAHALWSLRKLTKVDVGITTEAWETWWAEYSKRRGANQFAQNPASGLKEVSAEYVGFDLVHPVLVNNGRRAIYLCRIWPYGSARLMRWNEDAKKWEPGNRAIGCDTLPDKSVPEALKSGDRFDVPVYWELSTDDKTAPRFFRTSDNEHRPLAGRYKLVVKYAFKPWVVTYAKPVFEVESPEFEIAR